MYYIWSRVLCCMRNETDERKNLVEFIADYALRVAIDYYCPWHTAAAHALSTHKWMKRLRPALRNRHWRLIDRIGPFFKGCNTITSNVCSVCSSSIAIIIIILLFVSPAAVVELRDCSNAIYWNSLPPQVNFKVWFVQPSATE